MLGANILFLDTREGGSKRKAFIYGQVLLHVLKSLMRLTKFSLQTWLKALHTFMAFLT